MPSHQERREPLPKGYQFGDAKGGMYLDRAAVTLGDSARERLLALFAMPPPRMSEAFRAELATARRGFSMDGWNDIERGEH